MPYVTEQNLTDFVRERWQAVPDPRLRQVMQSFIKHVHAFVRDVEPTQAEWATAIDFLTRTGQKCDDKRQEFILFSDVMGVSMLVDALNNRLSSGATPTTVEGPFHVPNPPARADRGHDGRPVANATLDLWQTDGEGLYEAQRDVTEPWMRGLFHSKADGSYSIRTVAPIGYSIPMDGAVGGLVKITE